jgi:trans-AT polyketide synthase/acyltransferase/oxidoreductase domain-containing protein
MTAFVFPGQGSQFVGMGGDLFDAYRELTSVADDVLGLSVRSLCQGDGAAQLGDTRYTQPAIFTVSALAFLQRVEQTGRRPAYVAGHSLGELTALFAAGAFDFTTGLRIVKRRGELMSEARGGGMAAVLGLDGAKLQAILEHRFPRLCIANYNTAGQVVLSGPKVDVEAAAPELEAAGARCVLLPVSGAFHSPFMARAQEAFGKYLRDIRWKGLECPVISNVLAEPYDATKISDTLSGQLTSPVRWADSVRYLLDRGETDFVELGPGEVLTKMIKDIARKHSRAGGGQANGSAQANRARRLRALGPEDLGSSEFRADHGVKYAYVAGAMFRAVASKELVVRMARSGMLAFFGTGGLDLPAIEAAIADIQRQLAAGEPYGLNLLNNVHAPEKEERIVDLYLKHGVRDVEASAYMKLSPALVRYRLKGLRRRADGSVECGNRIMAKVSRPEVARQFMLPAPDSLVKPLLARGQVSADEAACATLIPMADDVCIEADSAGHTDRGVAFALMPVALQMRDEVTQARGYRIRLGAGGGIGTPEAAAAAFVLGADFILTGSINQCTVEAGTSEVVKDMLQEGEVQDTDYAPAGDMFELGAKVQVWRKGVFFPARANRLFDLYQRHGSLAELDAATRRQLEEKYFRCGCEDVYDQCKAFFGGESGEIRRAEQSPKHKMALVFRWYLARAQEWARAGDLQRRLDYQIHCGPALGAFNRWVRGTPLQAWKNRHVDEIGARLMDETAKLLGSRLEAFAHTG